MCTSKKLISPDVGNMCSVMSYRCNRVQAQQGNHLPTSTIFGDRSRPSLLAGPSSNGIATLSDAGLLARAQFHAAGTRRDAASIERASAPPATAVVLLIGRSHALQRLDWPWVGLVSGRLRLRLDWTGLGQDWEWD